MWWNKIKSAFQQDNEREEAIREAWDRCRNLGATPDQFYIVGASRRGWAVELMRAVVEGERSQAEPELGSQNSETEPSSGSPEPQPEPYPSSRSHEQKSSPELDWIKNAFFDPSGDRKACHLLINGINGDGKSTIGEVAIRMLSENSPHIRYILNPKHIASNPDWSVQPVCRSIDGAIDCLRQFVALMQARIEDPQFDVKKAPIIFFVVEEIDWICATYSTKAVNLVRSLIKVGRGVKCYTIMLGQDAALGSTKFVGGDFRQLVRVILGSEALNFIKNPQFSWDKSSYEPQIKKHIESGQRVALLIPTRGVPTVEVVPAFTNPIPQPLHPAPPFPGAVSSRELRPAPTSMPAEGQLSSTAALYRAVIALRGSGWSDGRIIEEILKFKGSKDHNGFRSGQAVLKSLIDLGKQQQW